MGSKEIDTTNYYKHPAVARVFMGVAGIEPGLASLVDDLTSLQAAEVLQYAQTEYYAVANAWLRDHKPGRGAWKSVKPRELPEQIGSFPKTDVFMSLWQREAELHPEWGWLPGRVWLVGDVEKYDNEHPRSIFSAEEETYLTVNRVGRALQSLSEELGLYGVEVGSGKGIHHVVEVRDPEIIALIARIGSRVEPDLVQAFGQIPANSKRDRTIPIVLQLVYQGAVRLQQFMFNLILPQLREELGEGIGCHFSDVGARGVALDITMMERNVQTGLVGHPGGLYMKNEIKRVPGGVVARLPRRVGREVLVDEDSFLKTRRDLGMAVEALEKWDGRLEDSSLGVRRLIELYDRSALSRLHWAVDHERRDAPELWDRGYRQYWAIGQQFPSIKDLMERASRGDKEVFLRPDNLFRLINGLYDGRFGGEEAPVGHIVGFLHAAYTNPLFYFGENIARHDFPVQKARAWVEIVLGERLAWKDAWLRWNA